VDGAGEVTANYSSCFSERIISVEAVDRVESYGMDFDEDFSWTGSWNIY
jgi:hypothetical protein